MSIHLHRIMESILNLVYIKKFEQNSKVQITNKLVKTVNGCKPFLYNNNNNNCFKVQYPMYRATSSVDCAPRELTHACLWL